MHAQYMETKAKTANNSGGNEGRELEQEFFLNIMVLIVTVPIRSLIVGL